MSYVKVSIKNVSGRTTEVSVAKLCPRRKKERKRRQRDAR